MGAGGGDGAGGGVGVGPATGGVGVDPTPLPPPHAERASKLASTDATETIRTLNPRYAKPADIELEIFDQKIKSF